MSKSRVVGNTPFVLLLLSSLTFANVDTNVESENVLVEPDLGVRTLTNSQMLEDYKEKPLYKLHQGFHILAKKPISEPGPEQLYSYGGMNCRLLYFDKGNNGSTVIPEYFFPEAAADSEDNGIIGPSTAAIDPDKNKNNFEQFTRDGIGFTVNLSAPGVLSLKGGGKVVAPVPAEYENSNMSSEGMRETLTNFEPSKVFIRFKETNGSRNAIGFYCFADEDSLDKEKEQTYAYGYQVPNEDYPIIAPLESLRSEYMEYCIEKSSNRSLGDDCSDIFPEKLNAGTLLSEYKEGMGIPLVLTPAKKNVMKIYNFLKAISKDFYIVHKRVVR